jgi:hypothetical protein
MPFPTRMDFDLNNKRTLHQMHQSAHSFLPSLSAVSPAGNIETPRGIFAKAIIAVNGRFSSDFEVNRSLFLVDAKSTAPRAPSRVKQQKLQPIVAPTPEVSPAVHHDLDQIQGLVERFPALSDSVPIDEVYRVSPILDRVLCTVGSWSPSFIAEHQRDPIVLDLQERLFALIDVDDFLLRTIVCRILLCFATDSHSPLLLPIARIFYKLSCDPTNDLFFVEESLENVLISLFRISEPEGKVFTAGTIRNVAACAAMRERLATPEFMDLIVETMEGNHEEIVKLQVLRAMRHMCSNESFRRVISERKLLCKLLKEPRLFTDAMRIISLLPEISSEEKLLIFRVLSEVDLSEVHFKRAVIRALDVLSSGNLDSPDFGRVIVRLIKAALPEPEFLEFLLPLANKCAESEHFQPDSVFVDIMRNTEYDTRVTIAAYAVVKKFPAKQFAVVVSQFKYLDDINVNS